MKNKILVIDDEEDILEMIRELLENENYEVLTTTSGEAGIDIAAQCLPDLIICDIQMPGIDGYTVLNRLSRSEATGWIPFIFLTGRAEHTDLRKGMELGADDYLFKPFRSAGLLSALKARLGKFQAIKAQLTDLQDRSMSSTAGKLGPDDNIFIAHNRSSVPVKVGRIQYISAESQYSRIVLSDNRQLLMRKSLAYWEALLPANIFVRIHRSTIVNLETIEKIEKSTANAYKAHLKHSTKTLEISRRYIKNIRHVK